MHSKGVLLGLGSSTQGIPITFTNTFLRRTFKSTPLSQNTQPSSGCLVYTNQNHQNEEKNLPAAKIFFIKKMLNKFYMWFLNLEYCIS